MTEVVRIIDNDGEDDDGLTREQKIAKEAYLDWLENPDAVVSLEEVDPIEKLKTAIRKHLKNPFS